MVGGWGQGFGKREKVEACYIQVKFSKTNWNNSAVDDLMNCF